MRLFNYLENFEYIEWEKLIALFAIICLSPLMLLIYWSVNLTSGGPGFYRQTRVGKNGKLFQIIKFRTMVKNAEKRTGATLSWEGDPRVTPLGKILRATHLDELPQLFNVLTGDMSFIGPRPERPEMTADYNETIQNYKLREKVRPGITGLAQITLQYNATPELKLHYDLYYAQNSDSNKLNLFITLYTIKKMLLGPFYLPQETETVFAKARVQRT